MASYRMTAMIDVEQLDGESQPTAAEVETALRDLLDGQQLVVPATKGKRFEGCRVEVKNPNVTGHKLGGTGC